MIEIIYFLLIFLAVFSLGKIVIDKLKLKVSFLESVVFSSAIGLGIFSYITLFLGISGLLYKSIFLFLIFLVIVFSRKGIIYFSREIKSLFRIIKSLKGLDKILFFIFLIFVFLNIIASLAPPYLWDEVFYDLAIPKTYVLHHKIIPSFDNFRALFPFNINLLFTMGILIENGILGKMFIFGFGTLLAVAIFTFTLRYFSLRAALFAALAYYTMPMVSNLIGSSYIDLAVGFYVFLVFYFFVIWIENNDVKWFYLSAAMSGLSIASKHTALFYLPIMALAILYKTIFKDKKGFLFFIKKSFAYFFIVFLLVSPWYVRNLIISDNPIWPLGYSIFGGKNWDSELAKIIVETHNVGNKSITSYFTILWNLTMHSSRYYMLLGFGPLFLVFIPLVILMKDWSKKMIYLLVYSILGISIWFFVSQSLRYLLIFPALSVVSGVVIASLLKEKSVKKFVSLALISLLIFNLAIWYGANAKKLPYVFKLETEKDFYAKLKDNNGYTVFEYANNNLPKSSKILLFREVRGYFSDIDYMIAYEYGQKIIDYRVIDTPEDLYKRLKELRITHVLINEKVEIFNPDNNFKGIPPYFSKRIVDLMSDILKKHSNLIFSDNDVYLYQLN